MSDTGAILRAAADEAAHGRPAVLATVVRVAGSTYRKPGARMLIPSQGAPVGLLSGGCLEGDLADRARQVLGSGESRTVVYDLRSPDDVVWGLGLGCAGEVRILLERIEAGAPPEHLSLLARCRERREYGVLVTVFAVEGGAPAVVGEHGTVACDGAGIRGIGDPELARAALRDARDALERGRSKHATYRIAGGTVDALIEHVAPPIALLVLGAGSDAVPLARIAADMGWVVTVVDPRPAYARADRFGDSAAVRVIDLARLERDLPPIDARTPVVVMTHHYPHDRQLLEHLLQTPTPYVGLLGPRKRTENLLRDVGARASERIRGPAGIDIGAESPAEIALAIAAEIQAVLCGRGAGFLRDRAGPLHDRSEE